MNIGLLIATLLASFKGQEQAFVAKELTMALTSENTRVNAGLTQEQINGIVNGLNTLAYAEQTALVNLLTAKLKGQ